MQRRRDQTDRFAALQRPDRGLDTCGRCGAGSRIDTAPGQRSQVDGRIAPGGRAFFAGAAAGDADAAGEACAWLVAQIRARAPFWRKEILADGTERWK